MKKEYIVPRIVAFKLHPANILSSSPSEEVRLRWSGEKEGEEGSDDIDDYSTYDSF